MVNVAVEGKTGQFSVLCQILGLHDDLEYKQILKEIALILPEK